MYQVMPVGLSNTSANFQSYINKILAEELNVFVIVYLNNILICTKGENEGHVETVYLILDLLWKNDLFASLKKCWFYKDNVCFL